MAGKDGGRRNSEDGGDILKTAVRRRGRVTEEDSVDCSEREGEVVRGDGVDDRPGRRTDILMEGTLFWRILVLLLIAILQHILAE